MLKKSIFEQILSGEIDSEILYEDEDVFAIKDINPVAKIHILIIPKKKIKTLNDIKLNDSKLISHMVLVGKKLAKKLKIDKSGYRLIINTNSDAGQTVFHIHLHLIGGEKLKNI